MFPSREIPDRIRRRPLPQEIRHLLFAAAEVVRAVVEYQKRSGSALQSGDVTDFQAYHQADGVHARFDIGGADWQRTVTVEPGRLAAALILYCKYRSIPLPADAAKVLHVVEGGVAMELSRNLTADQLPALKDSLMAIGRPAVETDD